MLQTKNIRLRDITDADIAKRIYWETVENEWQQWDGPWEYEGLTEEEKQEELKNYIEHLHQLVLHTQAKTPDATRYAFQIDECNENPEYIGWVNAYCIDEDCSYTQDETGRLAVGIDIPAMSARGKGYAYQALCLFIDYLLSRGEQNLYTQTWSGNVRMIHIAEKIGFEECCRKKDFRLVRGERYDGLTFKLNRDKFNAFCQQLNI